MPDYSHVVVGAGAVGLAIGARLSRAGQRVLVLEKNMFAGQETSSRNSEVVHAGLYYPINSLRTKMCIRGKQLIWEAFKKAGVQAKQCGKWIVAQTAAEADVLEQIYKRAQVTGVPLEWVPLNKYKAIEPAITANTAILSSPTTGIVSSHSLMEYYQAVLQAAGGDLVTRCKVVNLSKASCGYKIECETEGERTTLTADSVINSAGLYAAEVLNMLLPQEKHIKAFYAKGNYFSYRKAHPRVKRLVYPVPGNSGGLGTHLTIDLTGSMRFGPDFEWTTSPDDLNVNAENLPKALVEISKYVQLDKEALVPDYCGIRPKIKRSKEFQDFVIREEKGFPGFVSLLNIESPGLTASEAIAEYVAVNFT